MKIPFVKMHGAGNDFVMLNGVSGHLPRDLSQFALKICHRRFGIGADQILIVNKSDSADFRMEIYNADGGKVEMCGNGIRCLAKYVRDLKLSAKQELLIETAGGMIRPRLFTDHPQTNTQTAWVRVDMGAPELEGEKIPVRHRGQVISFDYQLPQPPLVKRGQGELGSKYCSNFSASDPRRFKITAISMGNPHCVIFVDDVQIFPVQRIGSVIENDPFFPQRVNVEFVQVINRRQLLQRTWERGSGETYACGTGASAVAVAAVLNNLTERQVTISLKGGDLDLEWDEKSGHVFKTGPATTVFAGEIDWEGA